MTEPIVSERRGDWFLSAKGRHLYPLDIRPEDVDIEEVIASLREKLSRAESANADLLAGVGMSGATLALLREFPAKVKQASEQMQLELLSRPMGSVDDWKATPRATLIELRRRLGLDKEELRPNAEMRPAILSRDYGDRLPGDPIEEDT